MNLKETLLLLQMASCQNMGNFDFQVLETL